MLVAITVFSMVMVIAVGALLTMVDANRKAQALGSVMNNLNFALESMTRNARIGTSYHCENDTTPTNIVAPLDCPSGGVLFAFEPFNGNPSIASDQVVYRLRNQRLERSVNGGSTFVAVTAVEVQIESLTFRVVGAPRAPIDTLQPKLVVTLRGTAGTSPRVKTTFALQTVVSQRVFDI